MMVRIRLVRGHECDLSPKIESSGTLKLECRQKRGLNNQFYFGVPDYKHYSSPYTRRDMSPNQEPFPREFLLLVQLEPWDMPICLPVSICMSMCICVLLYRVSPGFSDERCSGAPFLIRDPS